MLTASLITVNAEETALFGTEAGRKARPGEVWCLVGTLGAGKTAFIQGFAKGLGYKGRVTSPTFGLENVYEARLPLYHFDWYRLGSAAEVLDLGWEEWLSRGGVVLVEWGDKFSDLFPPATIQMEIEILDENARRLILSASIPESINRLQEITQCWPL
jgi:tRNA threonylcarbamoyladenosine biosynthesis protein TsaE